MRGTLVYIDGQNFLYGVAESLISAGIISDKQEVNSIDIPFLLKEVVEGESVKYKYYGVSKIQRHTEYGNDILAKAMRFSDNLRRLKNCLRKTGVNYLGVGSLKVRDRDECKKCGAKDYKFQEKGVDVGLAVDLVNDAFDKKVKKIVLISSDTDLIPAIKIIKEKNIELVYVAFDGRVTRSISRLASKTVALSVSVVAEAYARSLK